MVRNKVFLILISLFLVVACVIFPAVSTQPTGPASTPTTGAVVVPTSNPEDFKAEATSPFSVVLTWKVVDGAIGYRIEYSWNGKDYHPLIELPAVLTQYKDFLAQPDSTLTYRLQAITASGQGDWLVASATTGSRAPNPVTVQPTYDEASAADGTIGPAGGVVSLTDASGVTYELDIPAGALSADTKIQLIPLTGMDGWPLDGDRLAAVRIEPWGVQLLDAATLKITLAADPKPGLATVGFAFEPSGNEFHLRPVNAPAAGTSFHPSGGRHLALPLLQTTRVIQFQVIELHGNGVGQGSTGAITDLVKNNTPTDPVAQTEQQQAGADVVQDDLGALVPPRGQTVVDQTPAKRLEKEAVKIVEEVDKAVDGDSLTAAIEQFVEWQKTSNLLTPDQNSSLSSLVWDVLTNKFKALLDKAAEECKKSSGDPVPAGIGRLQQMVESASTPAATGSFWDVFKNKMTGEFGESVLDDARAGLRQGVCGTYQPFQGEQFKGNICSLGRPFTLNAAVIIDKKTVTFIPDTLDVGLVHVHQLINDGQCTFDGFGPYTVTYYSNGEADIQFQYSGVLVCPPAKPFPNATQPALHVRIKKTVIPECK